MSSLNNCTFVGKVSTDKISVDNSGDRPRAKFSLSVRRSQDKVDFVPCTAWGPQAEFASKYLKKGSAIAVSGEFRSTRSESNGQVRWYYGIDVYGINFLPPREDDGGGGGERRSSGGGTRKSSPEPEVDFYDDSPF